MNNKKPLLMLMSRTQKQLLLGFNQIKKNPSCMDCLFCISELKKNKKGAYMYEYKCTQFKTQTTNKITKNIAYQNISECRNDENKCGKLGKYYVPFSSFY